jgi:hypothetical protein
LPSAPRYTTIALAAIVRYRRQGDRVMLSRRPSVAREIRRTGLFFQY